MKKVMIITIAVLGAVLLIVLLSKLNTTRSEPSGSVGFVEEGTGAVRFTDKVSLSGIALTNGTAEGKYRIRYLSSVDKAYYDGLVGKYGVGNVTLKTIIFPLDFVAAGMTVDQLKAAGKQYLEMTPDHTFEETGNTYTFAGGINNVAESNYNRPFVGYAIIEINGGEIRYYPKEFDLETSPVFRSAAVAVTTGDDSAKTVSMRYYASASISYYSSLAETSGGEDKLSMNIAYCPQEYAKEAGGETLEQLDRLKHSPNYTAKVCTDTKNEVNNVLYSFYVEISPFTENLDQIVCPIGFWEIRNEAGTLTQRIYR